MVVEAGVVIVHPADQPGGHVLVAEQLLVGALAGVVTDVLDPQLGSLGQLGDERLELRAVEVAPARARHVAQPSCGCSKRAPQAGRAARAARHRHRLAERAARDLGEQVPVEPWRRGSPGSTTGRSEP